jgi:hypothetical protein
MLVNDYRLTALFQSSEVDFEQYLTGWLLFSIVDFDICDQSLSYTESTKTFTEALTNKNQVMLAKIMVRYWLSKEVADISQMSLKVQDRDFKTFSEAQHLREKSAYLNIVKEDISQTMVDYGLKTTDWAAWLNGDFYTP